MTVFLELFWSFFKIGITSFGGLSMIPLINSEMAAHGWMTPHEVTDIVAIAEMTPGPLGLNCATFCGIKTAGIPGAIVTNLGVLSPTLVITALVAVFFEKFKKSRLMQNILTGVRPACVGLVIGVAVSFSQTNYLVNGSVSPAAIVIGILDLILLLKYKFTVPKAICVSAALGFLFFGVIPAVL